jgi:ERCC4-type nuclease
MWAEGMNGLRVDSRAGSEELEAPLCAAGLCPEMTTLAAGDIELTGSGPGGRPLMVGVEFKTIPDVLACVRSGRFAEQARKMAGRYEVRWLLIEGEWQAGADGLLEVRERRGFKERGRYTMQEAMAWMFTMAQRGGVLMWRTRDRAETVAWLRALYWWWTAKEFEEHRAHLNWYTPPYTPENPMDMAEPSMAIKVAAALLSQGPTVDVNGERARAAGSHFGSVRALMAADEKAWREVEGIGAKIAKRVVEVVR